MIRQFTIIPALLGIAALVISACSAELGETGGNSSENSSASANSSAIANTGESTVLEGTWVRKCWSSLSGGYVKNIWTYTGNTFTWDIHTYSDSECTLRSSGDDLSAFGTFNIVDGGIVDGKQLTKVNYEQTTTKADGIASLFFPSGSTKNLSFAVFIDGDTMYDTDGETDLFSQTGVYNAPTKINDYDFYVRQ